MRFFFTLAVTTTMIATGGFGTFPDNPITEIFQKEIAQNIPETFLNPVNSYLDNLSAPTLQPKHASDSESDSPLDVIGLLFESVPATESTIPTELAISSEELTATLVSVQTEAALVTTTVTTIPTLTGTTIPTNTIVPVVSATIATNPTWTVPPIIIFPTSTRRPSPANTATSIPSATNTLTSTSTSTSTSTPTSTSTFTSTPTSTNTATATSTSTPTATATPTITNTPVSQIVLYSGGMSIGSIGPRSTADTFCTGSQVGYANHHAFIAYSVADNIANMPTNFGVPTNLPIKSPNGTLIANNWTDLLDGTIATTLMNAGVFINPGTYWWSGVEDASGTSIDGATQDCNEWTSSLNTDAGNYGNGDFTNSTWIDQGVGAGCYQMLTVLCVAY